MSKQLNATTYFQCPIIEKEDRRYFDPKSRNKMVTVFLMILYTPSFLLKISVIIKIKSHSWYPINYDWIEEG